MFSYHFDGTSVIHCAPIFFRICSFMLLFKDWVLENLSGHDPIVTHKTHVIFHSFDHVWSVKSEMILG